jgi:predicted acetyltransferase
VSGARAPAELRSLRPAERPAALALWDEVFGGGAEEYFPRYFEADPAYRDVDCHVALVEGQLVSAVLVCRRRMEWEGREILCGAVANVATREAFRRQGLSRALLARAIAAMESEGIAFSILLTGSPGHYAALGWEPVATPDLTLLLLPEVPAPALPVREHAPVPIPEGVRAIYDADPLRPLHFRRPPVYWEGWVARFWRWGSDDALLVAGDEGRPAGYAVLASEPQKDRCSLHEMRARDAAVEADLLRAAARWSRLHGRERLRFLPQSDLAGVLPTLGTTTVETHDGLMLRNMGLPEAEWRRLVSAYASGAALVWWADGF